MKGNSMKVEVTATVEQSGYALMQHTAKLCAAWKAALADGFQPGQDIPLAVMAVIAEGPAIMGAVSAISSEVSEDKIAFAKGVNIGAYDVIEALVK
jgi:hypothetical protein